MRNQTLAHPGADAHTTGGQGKIGASFAGRQVEAGFMSTKPPAWVSSTGAYIKRGQFQDLDGAAGPVDLPPDRLERP
jgi:hypothetical protein